MMNLASWIVAGVLAIALIGSLIYMRKHPSKCTGLCTNCPKTKTCKERSDRASDSAA